MTEATSSLVETASKMAINSPHPMEAVRGYLRSWREDGALNAQDLEAMDQAINLTYEAYAIPAWLRLVKQRG